MGTYIHGVFRSDAFRRVFLDMLGTGVTSSLNYRETVETVLDKFADHLITHLDCDAIWRLARAGNV